MDCKAYITLARWIVSFLCWWLEGIPLYLTPKHRAQWSMSYCVWLCCNLYNIHMLKLKRLTSLFCLRRTQDIISKYLPPKGSWVDSVHQSWNDLCFLLVENVVFCRMSSLQLSLYKHLLSSHVVRSCLHTPASSDHAFPPHLLCIAALKKLCNSPSLVHAAATKQGEGVWSEEGEAWEEEGGVKENEVC